MGRTLRRYVFVEVRTAFLVGLALAITVLFVLRIVGFVDLIFARGVEGDQVFALAGYVLPSYLEIALPMALMLAVVVGVGRLQADGEMLAMTAAGLSLRQIVRPIFALSLLVALASLALGVSVRPWAVRNIELTSYEMARTKLTASLRPGVFNSWFGGVIIYTDELVQESGEMENIVLSDERKDFGPRTLFARTGRVVSEADRQRAYLAMRDGSILNYHEGTTDYDRTDFKSFELYLQLREDAAVSPSPVDENPAAMGWQRLLSTRRRLVAAGSSALEETIELHRRLALPVATYLLPLIAVPLAVARARTTRSRGVVASTAAILIYYLLFSAAVTVARERRLDPALAMWLPNLALVALAAFLFARAYRGAPAASR